MEPLPKEVTAVVGGPRRCRGPAAACLLALAAAAGCVSLKQFTLEQGDTPPSGPAHQIVTRWSSEVVFTPDPAQGGAEKPGIAGRLYLFGPRIDFPLEGDGSVVVDLFDETPRQGPGGPAKEPVMLEEWRVDRDTLKRLLRKDMIGWGYTLFLPWGTYRPDITQVRLKVRYDPAHGSPLYAEGATLTINHPQAAQKALAALPPTPARPWYTPPGPAAAPPAAPPPAFTAPTGLQQAVAPGKAK
jgi:hypothetical protein